VAARFQPAVAREIEVTDVALVIVTRDGRVEVPWERCSSALGNATELERSQCRLSPAGYGIHWPLLDEDLAVGPLVDG
jgi:hypothetical protein